MKMETGKGGWVQLPQQWCTTFIVVVMTLLSTLDCQNQFSGQERTPKITKEILVLQKQGSIELMVGTTPFFAIEAQGTRPLHYVWSRDGIVIQNETTPFLTINSIQLSDSGIYRCLVQNKFGAARSLPFSLTVTEKGMWPENAPNQTVLVEERKFALLRMPDISYFSDPDFYIISWQRDGQTIHSDDLNTYVALDHSLAILNIPQSFNGSGFRVSLMHIDPTGFQQTFSNTFVLNVTASSSKDTFMAPEFVISPRDVEAAAGTNAKMECVINGQPFNNLQVTWFKGDDTARSLISTGDGHLDLSSDSRVLTIQSISATDAGVYGCEGTVTGQPATVKHQATLTVLVPPAITKQSSPLMIKDFQESLLLDCQAAGSPTPQVQWYFNGVLLLKDSSDITSRFEIHPNNSLTIRSVDLPDSGVYQCFANNSAGEVDTYTELFVNSAPPTVIQAPSNKTVAEHEDTGFTCQVSGGPRPDIYWTKDGVNVTVGGRIRITQQELLIGRSELADSGLYTCHAVNIKGSVSAEATLVVVVKTQITQPPQNKSRILTTDARMECGVRHDPTVIPIWTWYFTPSYASKAQKISEVPGNREILADGTLLLYNLIGDDSGIYECVVTSKGGNDSRKATLNVIELPAPPQITSVVLNDDLPNSVRINWTQGYDGHTPIIKFIIQSRLESFSTGSTSASPWETINSDVNPALRSIVVADLQPSKFYRFRMIAVNRVNESLPSEAAPRQAIKMPAQPPSDPPRNVYCRPDGERQIIVQWDPPPTASWNGDLQGYYIYYKVKNFGVEKQVDVSGTDTLQKTIGFLAYNMQYRINVAAYNEKGAGVRSKAYYVTTLEGRPSAPPTNVVLSSPNSTTIKVEWNPPDTRVLNGNNQGYDIDVVQGGQLKRVEDFRYDDSNPTGRQTYYITNLLKYTEYTIQIACKTRPGPGPKSDAKTIRTLEDVPGPVTNLKIVSTAEQNMFFTWEPPDDLNGVIKGYEIVHQKKDGTSPAKTEMRGPDARSHTLLNLAYDSVYNISVRARTNVGFGPAVVTEFSSAEPPQQPHPPTQLKAIDYKARSVLLQFRPGFDGKATITLWIVEAQIEDDETWKEIYSIRDPDADQILVKNMYPYTYYRLRILAQNVFAKSEPSEPSNRFLTQQAIPSAAPEEVTPRAISPTAIRVRWRQVPRSEWNGDFLGYKIFYRRWSTDFDLNKTSPADLDLVREKTWTIVTLRNGSNIQGHTLLRLEEWMQYQVQMKAYNAVGEGPESVLETERTSEGVPSASPLNIQPQAIAPTSIRVTWSPVPILHQNGNIKGYKVKYKAHGSRDEEKFEVVEGEDTMNTTLTGLRMFVEYDIQVLAYSRIGDGVLSSKVTIRTLAGAPGPPVNIWFPEVSENSVTIVWQQPDEPNGVIRRYKVAWRRFDESVSVMQTNSVDKNIDASLSHTVSGLNAETTYIFSVTARTQDDWGEEAIVEVYTRTNRDRPNPPYNVRIGTSEIKARSMDIYWSEGNTNFGPIRNYTIQYRLRSSIEWNTVEEIIGPGTLSYIVYGLQPNSYYSFRVAATNDLGMSNFSAPSNERQTLQDKPDGAPQNVAIVALTRESIKITWEPPPEDTWNGFLLQDIVMFREEGAEVFREVPPIPYGTFTTTMQRLTIGVRYEIRVSSENSVGRGPPSVLQVFRVGDIAPFEAPQDLQVTNKSSSELFVSWTPPPKDSTNGDLIGYK
ncbi:protein sidekick-2, partial [Plakobranchus ocellatus]